MNDNSIETTASPGRISAVRALLRKRTRLDDLAQLESSRYLFKWLMISTIIGVVAGLGAIVFQWALRLCTRFFLGGIVGYMPPMPLGEGEPIIQAFGRPWLLPLVTMLGGLLSGFIVYRWAPEAEGHGTDAAIESVHFKRGFVDPKIPPIKLIASAITIGSGGSGGREGPTAQISSGFGSMLATWLRLGPDDRRIAVTAGMGAGLGAIFRAPLGGALMCTEILYLHDMEIEALLPALMASIVGYSVYGFIDGWTPIFGAQPGIGFDDPITLVWYAGLGVVLGLGGLLYAKSFYTFQDVFRRLRIPLWIKPGIGGLLVGLLGLWIAGSLHTGYGWVQIGMSDEIMSLPLWTIIALPFAKIIATSFSIGSGGSGGIFGPGMVIGGMFGATFWRLGEGVLPHMPDSPAPFVIIGMMGLFGSIAHAPFAVMLMVAEMTGNLSLLAPAMICVAIATALVGDASIYKAQLYDRTRSPAHRIKMSFPLLSALSVRDAMQPAVMSAPAGSDDERVAVGIDDDLDDALQRLAEAEATHAVVEDRGQAVGELTNRDALAAYKKMLQRGVRRANAMPAASMIVEGELRPGSSLIGNSLRDAKLPQGTLVVSINRTRQTIFPTAETMLQQGDVLTAVVAPADVRRMHALMDGL